MSYRKWSQRDIEEWADIKTDEYLMASYERRQNERHLRNIRKHGNIISTQTLRLEDLVPAYLEVLKAIDTNLYNEYVYTGLGNEATVEDIHDENSHIYQHRHVPASPGERNVYGMKPHPLPPLAFHFLDELTVALEQCCPPGVRFGAHPGNGSDIGFWPAPCEQHEDQEWPLNDCTACQDNVEALLGMEDNNG